jgi:uncharacterized membrane protein
MFLGFMFLALIAITVASLIIGKFIVIGNFVLLIVGIASIFTAALFVKQQRREPTSGEKLLFASVAAIILLILFLMANFYAFIRFGNADAISYILSVKFLLSVLIQTFLEFATIYVTFHFYTKSAAKKQQNSD